jgi:hypothetical protein
MRPEIVLALVLLLPSGCAVGRANVRRDINGEPNSLAVRFMGGVFEGVFDGMVDATFAAVFGTDDEEDGISDHELERKGIERGSERYDRLVAEEANLADLQEKVDALDSERQAKSNMPDEQSQWRY